MSQILHRSLTTRLPVAVEAEGIRVRDSSGNTYIDACGGAAVSCLGHGHPRLREALLAQLDTIAYMHTGFFTTEAAEALASRLIGDAPSGMSHAMVLNGGSEAVEATLKMARQYHVERGEPQRRHIIARRQSYHGNTLGALATGGNEGRRRMHTPILIETHHIDPCFAYRYQRADESDADYAARAAQQLEDKILELGTDSVMAFAAETVVGATAGVVPPVGDYFRRVREICDRYGVLLIMDEIMCGMGRTGTLHACEQEGVAGDIQVMAKGLGAGYQPVSAVLVSQKVHDTFLHGSGAFVHGHTYMGHPMAAAAALAVQEVIAEDNLLENVRLRGAEMMAALQSRFAGSRYIGDIRGRGLFIGLELVQDRDSKVPFDPEMGLASRLKARAMDNGLMIYPGSGTIDGKSGDHILLAPPYILTAAEVGEIVGRLGDTVDQVLAGG
ncbi:adenosylmethionine-8-amino-7-oxononanoate aminotransferase [Mycoplana sp. BE70]|uniref:aspartate aminotransferase family protein n=1 Tax=Mycoplana sp. BE70 TaxID=2817775 RepID=UPI002859B90B|nr:aspartate aminotransferase family protein [Mycoplana sp. BE70]MDR6759261.1 adenosylmethionine-8-amino-7-oxononanoate aminotransferase [Mycoplana sp. BE70]